MLCVCVVVVVPDHRHHRRASVRLSVQIVDPSDDSPAEKGSFLSVSGGEYRSAAADDAGLPKIYIARRFILYINIRKQTERWYMKTGKKKRKKQNRPVWRRIF